MLDQGPPGPLLTDLGQTTTPSASADAFADALPRGDIEEDITSVQARIEQAIAPFAPEVALLDTVVGVRPVAARAILAELGPDMSVFPTAAHCASRARICPAQHASAGNRRPVGIGHGSRWVRTIFTDTSIL